MTGDQRPSEAPATPSEPAPTVVRDSDPGVPAGVPRVPGYRVLDTLGEGGMGAVYRAEQASPRRVVALKVIKPGVLSPEHLHRFARETEVLGRLQHIGIAHIYEAGTAEGGRAPYFAMEYVVGKPLTAHAETRRLDTRARLALMADICDAVHHAHQRGVIHRDLKPANILVTESGQPKILDFGIARLTDADVQATMGTDLGQLVGTLPYMSPEQVGGDPLELDTRSDVYTLGVILFELLAGRRPYPLGRQLTEAARIITEEEPPSLGTIDRAWRGDVEAVVARSLEKEKTARYQSAAELAADIRRFLADEPIEARPLTTIYQLRKFTRRHRALVGGAAATVAALVVGLVATGYFMLEARAERDRATAEAGKATAINAFLQETLGAANPYEGTGREVTVLEALDVATEQIAALFAEQPEIRAAVELTIGSTYSELDQHDRAEPLLRSSLAIRRELFPGANPEVGDSLTALGLSLFNKGDQDGGEAAWREALELRRALYGEAHPDIAELLNMLAVLDIERGNDAAAESLQREALAMRRSLGTDEDVAESLNNLAVVVGYRKRDYPAAIALLREAVAIQRTARGEMHPDLVPPLGNLAGMLSFVGEDAEAESHLREALAIGRASLGEHPDVAGTMNILAEVLRDRGDYDEAESLLREALAMRRGLFGEQHTDVASTLNSLGTLFRMRGDLAGAEPFHREALAIRTALGEGHPLVARTRRALGETLTGLGRYREAEEVLVAAHALLLAAVGEEHTETQQLVDSLVEVYDAWDKPDQAAEYRRLLREPEP